MIITTIHNLPTQTNPEIYSEQVPEHGYPLESPGIRANS